MTYNISERGAGGLGHHDYAGFDTSNRVNHFEYSHRPLSAEVAQRVCAAAEVTVEEVTPAQNAVQLSFEVR